MTVTRISTRPTFDEGTPVQARRGRGVTPMDVINGTNGNDTLFDTAGNDTINGLAGNDRITVTNGADQVNGGGGSDTLVLDYATLTTALVTNALTVNSGGGFNGQYAASPSGRFVSFDSIENFNITTGTGAFNDSVRTGSGNDVVNANAGDDLINVGLGKDTADGGDGLDGIAADFSVDARAVKINLDNALNNGKFGRFSNFEYFSNITGSDFNDSFTGGTDANKSEVFNLGDGDDVAEVLNGVDTVNGGDGDDKLILDYRTSAQGLVTNALTPNAGGGFDGQYAASPFGSNIVNFSSIENFDITTSTGVFTDVIRTGSGDDEIRTNKGDDFIDVGSGKDTADGGAGVDGLAADFSDDTRGVTIDLDDAVNEGKFGEFSNFEYFGNITGSEFDDSFTGGTDANKNESLDLGDGDDVVEVRNGFDTVLGGAGDDTLIVDYRTLATGVTNFNPGTQFDGGYAADPAGPNAVFFQSIENFDISTGTGDFDDNLSTFGGDDTIAVFDGSDSVSMGAGIDTLVIDYSSANGVLTTEEGPTGSGELNGEYSLNFSNHGVSYFGVNRFDITGTGGDDSILTATGDDAVDGGNGKDTINGGGGDDTLDGGKGKDKLQGGGGADRLVMSEDADDLTGNGGDDVFVLTDNFAAGDAARVRDFSGSDIFEVSASDFGGGLTAGVLPNSAFVANGSGTAQDTSDRFIYNTSTGSLFYDSDGSGAGAALLIATLDGAPTVTASDFLVV